MGLKHRLYLVLMLIVLTSLLAGLVLLSGVARKQIITQDEQRLSEVAQLLSQDVVFATITDDMARLNQRLGLYVQQGFLQEVRWVNPSGNTLFARSAAELQVPGWFVGLMQLPNVTLTQEVVWFDKPYGKLTLIGDATRAVNDLWQTIQYWLWVLVGLLLAIVLAVEWVLYPGLRQLSTLIHSAHRLRDQVLDEPIHVVGYAEFSELAAAMEQMRKALQKSLSQSQQQQLDLMLAHSESQAKQHQLHTLLDTMPAGVLLEDAQRRVVFANQRYCDLFAIPLTAQEMQGMDGGAAIREMMLLFADAVGFVGSSERAVTFRKMVQDELLEMRDGRWLMRDFIPVLDDAGKVQGHFWMYRDVSANKQLELALAAEKELAQVTLASIGDGVITTNALGLVSFMNQEAERLTGWTLAQVQNKPVDQVFDVSVEGQSSGLDVLMSQVLRTGVRQELGSHASLRPRGSTQTLPIEQSISPIRDREGRTVGAVLVFRDMSDTWQLEQDLRWQASHDPLTDLANRRAFEQALAEAIVQEEEMALLYLDLDQFKVVNDTAGHMVGDQMLRELAERFAQLIAPGDLLARMGGDEFAVLMSGATDKAMNLAEDLRQVTELYRFDYLGRVYQVGLSVGVVPFRDASSSAEMLLAMADAACYAAKHAGRNQVWLYKDSDEFLRQQQQEMHVVSDIHAALEANLLELHAQKLVDLQAQDEHVHLEILVRMRGADGKMIPPGDFIPAAEHFNLMHRIDRWVIEHTLAFLGGTPGVLDKLSLCAINLSGQSLGQTGLGNFIRASMEQHGVPGHKLCFEVTETAAVSQLSQAAELISDLRSLGCHFALDDFGSGQSSFRYLKQLPVDYLKIDGSFVQDMLQDTMDAALVRGMHEIASTLGMRTVAEYVENGQIADTLREVGVNYAQGWHFHRPEPVANLFR